MLPPIKTLVGGRSGTKGGEVGYHSHAASLEGFVIETPTNGAHDVSSSYRSDSRTCQMIWGSPPSLPMMQQTWTALLMVEGVVGGRARLLGGKLWRCK